MSKLALGHAAIWRISVGYTLVSILIVEIRAAIGNGIRPTSRAWWKPAVVAPLARLRFTPDALNSLIEMLKRAPGLAYITRAAITPLRGCYSGAIERRSGPFVIEASQCSIP